MRAATEHFAAPLAIEDQVLQSMPDCSPTRWHLAHTTWFFEAFVLAAALPGFRPFDPRFEALFNSYYRSVGTPFPRERRGLLSRPTVAETLAYRAAVDDRMCELLGAGDEDRVAPDIAARIVLGLEHEQQHQELILTDALHALAQNPLRPAYRGGGRPASRRSRFGATEQPLQWIEHGGGLVEIGTARGAGFAFDNEGPRHRVHLEPFRLASRLATNAEYMQFIADGGYRRPELWLSDGWAFVEAQRLERPLYWEAGEAGMHFTLDGPQPIDPLAPVAHVSHFEADAFARWSGARLPSEAEWEVAASAHPVEGNFVERGLLHPAPAPAGAGLQQLFGDAWEWTQSAYLPYPGYRAAGGALGEYNGKFMSGQIVLRGGSCASPGASLRASYRNFFPPAARWQFSGIRLASDAGDA